MDNEPIENVLFGIVLSLALVCIVYALAIILLLT